jgi:hypothetical protein
MLGLAVTSSTVHNQCLIHVMLLPRSSSHLNGSSSPGSYVISVQHQTVASQPYPRAASGKAISFLIGRADRAKPYTFTVNTASSVLMMTCRTAAARSTCGDDAVPASDNYAPLVKHYVRGSACNRTSTGVGCVLSDANSTCFVSEPVSAAGANSIQ